MPSRARAVLVLAVVLALGANGCASAAPPTAAAPTEAEVARAEAKHSAPPPASRDGARGDAATGGPAWLGVELASAAPGEAGVIVRSVMPRSPALESGLEAGDRILRLGMEEVSRPQDVVRIVSTHHGGERLGVAFVRGGADRLVGVVLAERPDQDALLKLELGDGTAPAWRSLATVRGSVPATLAELRGRVVVVEFWASWCVACRMSVPMLNAWHDRYRAQGLTVLGVTTDSPEVALQASLEMGMDYPVLSDVDGETTRAYKAYALPTLFVIDRDGKIRVAMVGYSSAGLAKTEAELGRLLASDAPAH